MKIPLICKKCESERMINRGYIQHMQAVRGECSFCDCCDESEVDGYYEEWFDENNNKL